MTEHITDTTVPGQETLNALRENLMEVERLTTQHQGADIPAEELSRRFSTLQEQLTTVEQKLETQALEREEFAALLEVSHAIGSTLDLTEVLNKVMDQIIHLTGAERSILMLVNPETEELELRAARNVDYETIDSSAFEISRSIVNQVAESGEPVVTTNAQSDPRFKARESVIGYKLRSILCVPLEARRRITGVIYADNRARSGPFSDRDRDLLAAFASQAAVAIENARLFEDLKTRNEENRRLNKELTEANRELSRLDQAKSDFIDIASHELRTPLTQVRGYNDILSEMFHKGAVTTQAGLKMTHGIRRASMRLEEVVDAMFDVSRLETETLSLSTSAIQLSSVISAAVQEWEEALEKRDLTLEVEGIADLPTIKGDGTRLVQAFSHLVQNAIKYTPDEGEIQITGCLSDSDAPPQEQAVGIVVADTGIGIAVDDLERIFKKFYRVGDVLLHSTGKAKFKGAGPGLGLAITRGIVKAHGGEIWAKSPGCDEDTCPGSEFHVVLPVEPPV